MECSEGAVDGSFKVDLVDSYSEDSEEKTILDCAGRIVIRMIKCGVALTARGGKQCKIH